MYTRAASNFNEWRHAARPLLRDRVAPRDVCWGVEQTGVAYTDIAPPPLPDQPPDGQDVQPRISAALLRVLETVSMYRDAGRWELMYRLAWRTMFSHPQLMQDAADPDVRHACLMERAVRRDVHKMHAYVRFRETTDAAGTIAYFAWFEPQHEILHRAAVFFVKRFANMNWTIATPDGTAVWQASTLKFVEPPAAADRPRSDPCEDLWRTYYRSVCNVARLNPAAMQREMPRRYWQHLPEAVEINLLIRDGMANFAKKHHQSPDQAGPLPRAVQRALPDTPSGEGPQACRRCDLWQRATQAVLGTGPARASLMLVGEQPGDEEDIRGQPFVGPAGKVLDRALSTAGIDRSEVFITNAVKHFKWEPRGKRRLHKKPGVGEIQACNVWLEGEIATAQPRVIVALGASALRALTGSSLSIDAARQQQLIHPDGARIIATYHPSAILRADGERAAALAACLDEDLRRAAGCAADPRTGGGS